MHGAVDLVQNDANIVFMFIHFFIFMRFTRKRAHVIPKLFIFQIRADLEYDLKLVI